MEGGGEDWRRDEICARSLVVGGSRACFRSSSSGFSSRRRWVRCLRWKTASLSGLVLMLPFVNLRENCSQRVSDGVHRMIHPSKGRVAKAKQK